MKKRFEIYVKNFGDMKYHSCTNSIGTAIQIYNSIVNSTPWLPNMEKIYIYDTKNKSIIKKWTKTK